MKETLTFVKDNFHMQGQIISRSFGTARSHSRNSRSLCYCPAFCLLACLLLAQIYFESFVFNCFQLSLTQISFSKVSMSYCKRSVAVSQLPPETGVEDMTSFFGSTGEIDYILFRKDSNKQFTGKAFVVYKDANVVGKTLSDLSTQHFQSTTLKMSTVPELLELEISDLLNETNSSDVQDLVDRLTHLSESDLRKILSQIPSTSVATSSYTVSPPVVTPLVNTTSLISPTLQTVPTVQPYQLPKLPTFSGDNLKVRFLTLNGVIMSSVLLLV